MTDTAAGADAAVSPPRRRRVLRQALRLVLVLVALGAVALCVVALARQWSAVEDAVRGADVLLLVLAALVAVVMPFTLGVAWWRCLAVFGTRVPLTSALRWYFVGELGKYVPGGVWPVVGRGEMAAREGVGRSVAYASTLVSMATMCVSAGAVGAVLVPFLLADGRGVGADLLVLLLLPAGAVAVHPVVFGRLLRLGRRLTRGRLDLDPPPWSDMLQLVLWNVPAWLALGGSSVLVAAALDGSADPARLAFAAVLAWIVGFLAVPLPAGAGVREIVFVTVCGLAAGPAVAVAAISRLFLLSIDLIGGVAGLVASRRRSTPPSPAPASFPGTPAAIPTGGPHP